MKEEKLASPLVECRKGVLLSLIEPSYSCAAALIGLSASLKKEGREKRVKSIAISEEMKKKLHNLAWSFTLTIYTYLYSIYTKLPQLRYNSLNKQWKT